MTLASYYIALCIEVVMYDRNPGSLVTTRKNYFANRL